MYLKEHLNEIELTNWDELYEMAKKQSLVGVLFAGIQKLPKAMHPEKKLLLKWV